MFRMTRVRGLSGHPTKNGFQDRLSLNAGNKYSRMLQQYFLPTLNYPSVLKIFVLSISEWQLKTGFTVFTYLAF